jgi:hypothetical protein
LLRTAKPTLKGSAYKGKAKSVNRLEKTRSAPTRKRGRNPAPTRAYLAWRARIEELEARIAATEQALRDLEEMMAAPGFYDDRSAAQPVIDRHQALMWEVGDLMHQWEELQTASDLTAATDA